MKKTIAAATVAASVAVGGLAGSVMGVPALAGAQEAASGAARWVDEAISGLVDDGTITQKQSDAVETALKEARPERRFGHRPGGGFGSRGFGPVAEALDMTKEELRTALENKQTIADVAAAEGVDVQIVIEAIVAATQERVEAAVAEGKLTPEQAEEKLADAPARAIAMVNGEKPMRGGPGGPRPRGPRTGDADRSARDSEQTTTDTAT